MMPLKQTQTQTKTDADLETLKMIELLLILAILAYGLIATAAMRVREIAVIGARQHCVKLELQLLDQSVSLSHTRVRRHPQGRLSIHRLYTFDFTSTGDERYRGSVAMLGNSVQEIMLEPHRLPDAVNDGLDSAL